MSNVTTLGVKLGVSSEFTVNQSLLGREGLKLPF